MTVTWISAGIPFKCKRYGELSNTVNRYTASPVLCCVVLYCVVLCCVVLCRLVLYCVVLYCVVLCCVVLYQKFF